MAAPSLDPYAELSIPPTATQEQIRRAYKRACLAHHPDKHPAGPARAAAEARFKSIVRAYTLLTEGSSGEKEEDPFSDAEYCRNFAARFAEQCRKEGFNMNAESVFDSLFGEERRRSFEQRAAGMQEKPEDKVVDLALSLEELCMGCVKKRKVRAMADNNNVLSISIRPGYRPGDRVRFPDALPVEGRPNADVVFVLSLKQHDRFVMRGDDLFVTMRIRLVDALAGAAIMVKGVDGEDVHARVDCVVHPGYVHVVGGGGMPKRECAEERGDLCINFEVAFPQRVEMEDRQAIREVFDRMERRAKMGVAMRRSSSLFVGKGWNGFAPRRNSMANMGKEEEEEEPVSLRGRFGKGRLRMPSVFK